MSQGYVLSFAKGVTVDRPSADCATFQMPVTCRKFILEGFSPGLGQVIDVLCSIGATEDDLAGLVEELEGASALARLYYFLFTFAERRILSYGVSCGGRQLATLAPASASFKFTPGRVDPQLKYTLSRFAYLHRVRENLILESPLSHGRVTLPSSAGAAVTAELSKPHTLGSLCDVLHDLPRDIVMLFLELLIGAGFVSGLNIDEPYPGENEALAQWDFHDLLFHARSRLGRHDNPYGGTYRFRNEIKPLPAIKQLCAEEIVDLYRPDMDSLQLQDCPFTMVLEQRRSIRDYGERPITDRQLGEFLYRSARVKELQSIELQDVTRRPYPGGGGIYELELHVNVHRCENVPAGLYHYCPSKHRLEKIGAATEAVEALLKDAARPAGLAELPQIVITITARFQRLAWKYESIAYSVILKDVGVLYQTMFLVATAMDLAPCALGGGDSDLFSRAAGLDYYVETSVGEFLLGSKKRMSHICIRPSNPPCSRSSFSGAL